MYYVGYTIAYNAPDQCCSAGGLHCKGFGGHADTGMYNAVVSIKSSRVEIVATHYSMLELIFFKVLSHTDTVRHVAEDASESAFTKYSGADEIVGTISMP